jgi:hypothetical protein
MNRVHSRRFQFDRDENGNYTACVGRDAEALLTQDCLGWRGVLVRPDSFNADGIYLTRTYWGRDQIRQAVNEFDFMINDYGGPRFANSHRGKPFWYGETEFLSGPLLDGRGDWMKIGHKVVTVPPRKRRTLVPEVARAPWHQLVAKLQMGSFVLQHTIGTLLRLMSVGSGEPIDHRKQEAARALAALISVIEEAEAQHVPWDHRGLMPPKIVDYVRQARAAGVLTLTP